jgi:hypothetical protein
MGGVAWAEVAHMMYLDCWSYALLLSAENQLSGAACNHVCCRVCSWAANDLWHHGGVRHAQAHNAMHAQLRVNNSKFVHAGFAGTNPVSKTRRAKSDKFSDLFSGSLRPRD